MIFCNEKFDDLQIEQENITTSDSLMSNFQTESSLDPLKMNRNVQRSFTGIRKRSMNCGKKDRTSKIYKYLKQSHDNVFRNHGKGSNSLFSSEEDEFLILLIKELGPRFEKITKYFPGKTLNMIKNRYYSKLRSHNVSLVPKESLNHLRLKTKQLRLMAKNLVTQQVEKQLILSKIDDCIVIPEAKILMKNLLTTFDSIIQNCLKHI